MSWRFLTFQRDPSLFPSTKTSIPKPQSPSDSPILSHSHYNKLCSIPYHIPLKFANMKQWQWCITLQSTKFLDHFLWLIIINEIRWFLTSFLHRSNSSACFHFGSSWVFTRDLSLILPRSRKGTVWFYTSTSNKRAARPKLYTKSLTRDLKRMYSRLTLVRIYIKL